MNCENCEAQLLALLYGELDPTSAARVREHSDGCASCGAARGKLESARRIVRQLALEAPPARVHSAIMERAQAHARGEVVVARPTRDERAAGDAAQGPLERFVAWLGGFVLGPQVAMAMVLLLMVGVGLYYLPGMRTSRNVPGGAIVNADPGDEAGPSAAVQPAAPLDLRLDTRTNRLLPGDGTPVARAQRGEPSPATNPAPGAVVTGPLPAPPAAELAALTPPTEARAAEANVPSSQVVADVLDEQPVAQRPARDDSIALRRSAANAGELDAVADTSAATREELAIAATDSERMLAPQAPQGGAPAAAAELQAPAAPPPPSPPPMLAVAPAGGMRQPTRPSQPSTPQRNAPAAPSAMQQAPAAMPVQYAMPSGGSYAAGGGASAGSMGVAATGSTAPQTQAQSPLLAAAGLHGVARNQATANALRSAIGTYESLLSRFPTYDRSGEAMLELAELYRRVGDLTHARAWIARAEGLPAYAARARQQRFRVDEMDRARTSVPAAAAPSGL
jgi:hypothetical protein